MSSVVLNDKGRPEAPSDLQRRLGQVHPRLFLRHVDAADAVWAVCMRWDEHDPRFGEVQAQVIDPERSFDIIGYLPRDCSLNEAPAHLERAFRQYPKEAVQQVANRVSDFNKSVVNDAADQVLGEILDQRDPSNSLPKLTRPKRR
jgi:hypothetical protein